MAEVWNIPGVNRPPFVTRLLRGLGLLGLLGTGLVATAAIASISAFGGGVLTKAAGVVLSISLNVGLFVLAFRVLTVKKIPTRALVPGAILGGVGWSLLQVVGGYLVGHQLRNASQVYGYFASVLGLVSWIFLGAQLTLYAAEANVVWARRLWPRSIVQPPLTEADKRAFDYIAIQGERRPEQSVDSEWDDGDGDARVDNGVTRSSVALDSALRVRGRGKPTGLATRDVRSVCPAEKGQPVGGAGHSAGPVAARPTLGNRDLDDKNTRLRRPPRNRDCLAGGECFSIVACLAGLGAGLRREASWRPMSSTLRRLITVEEVDAVSVAPQGRLPSHNECDGQPPLPIIFFRPRTRSSGKGAA